MKTIIVAGASSKAGKTTLAEALLRRLPRQTWSGVKITVADDISGDDSAASHDDGVRQSATGGYRLITDPEIIAQPNTDTGRLIRAGADPVLWAITTPPLVSQVWHDVQQRIKESAGVVVESTRLALSINSDIVFFIINPRISHDRWKASTPALIEQSDFLIINLHDSDRQQAQDLIADVDAQRHGRGVVVTESIEKILDRETVRAKLGSLSMW